MKAAYLTESIFGESVWPQDCFEDFLIFLSWCHDQLDEVFLHPTVWDEMTDENCHVSFDTRNYSQEGLREFIKLLQRCRIVEEPMCSSIVFGRHAVGLSLEPVSSENLENCDGKKISVHICNSEERLRVAYRSIFSLEVDTSDDIEEVFTVCFPDVVRGPEAYGKWDNLGIEVRRSRSVLCSILSYLNDFSLKDYLEANCQTGEFIKRARTKVSLSEDGSAMRSQRSYPRANGGTVYCNIHAKLHPDGEAASDHFPGRFYFSVSQDEIFLGKVYRHD